MALDAGGCVGRRNCSSDTGPSRQRSVFQTALVKLTYVLGCYSFDGSSPTLAKCNVLENEVAVGENRTMDNVTYG